MVDGGAFGDDDNFYKNDNATEIRAARLGIEGNFLQGWKYKFETDSANSTVSVKDAYIDYSGESVKPAYVRVGQYKTQIDDRAAQQLRRPISRSRHHVAEAAN